MSATHTHTHTPVTPTHTHATHTHTHGTHTHTHTPVTPNIAPIRSPVSFVRARTHVPLAQQLMTPITPTPHTHTHTHTHAMSCASTNPNSVSLVSTNTPYGAAIESPVKGPTSLAFSRSNSEEFQLTNTFQDNNTLPPHSPRKENKPYNPEEKNLYMPHIHTFDKNRGRDRDTHTHTSQDQDKNSLYMTHTHTHTFDKNRDKDKDTHTHTNRDQEKNTLYMTHTHSFDKNRDKDTHTHTNRDQDKNSLYTHTHTRDRDRPRMMHRRNVSGTQTHTQHMRATSRQEYGPLPTAQPLPRVGRSSSGLSKTSKKAPRQSGLKYYRNEIFLNVYDLDIMFKKLNDIVRRMNTGVYHVGIEVYDVEYAYGCSESGTGVFESTPQESVFHIFRESIRLGRTQLDDSEVRAVVKNLRIEWQGNQYDLTSRNCTHFAADMALRLGVERLPTWVKNLSFRLDQIKSFGAYNRRKQSIGGQSVQRKPSMAGNISAGSGIYQQPTRYMTESRRLSRDVPEYPRLASHTSASRPDPAAYLCGDMNSFFPKLRKMCC